MIFFRRIFKRGIFSDSYLSLESRQEIMPEDILSDVSTQFSPSSDAEKKLEIPVQSSHTSIFFALVFVTLLFLGVYALFLFVTRGNEYARLALNNAQQVYEINARRGQILSSDGVILASSDSLFNLVLNPSQLRVQDVDTFVDFLVTFSLQRVSTSLNVRIRSAQEKNLGELLILKHLSDEDISALKDFLDEYHSVLSLREAPIRLYPQDNKVSHLLGYTASITEEELTYLSDADYSISDYIGKGGIEYYFEDLLRGERGLFAKIVTSLGEVRNEKMLKQPLEGATLKLSLNMALQEASYNALQKGLTVNGITKGAVVVLEPDTGRILALVSLPDFDPNDFARGLSQEQADAYFNNDEKPLFSRALLGEYPTGSIIKPLMAAAALEEGIIDARQNILTQGFISVPSVYDSSVIYTFLDWKNHGWVDMRKALAVSSNVYFYIIGGGYKEQPGLGIDAIKKRLAEFGWGNMLGINFGSESAGLIPSPQWKESVKGERWTIGDTYNVSIGQGDVLATPLQITSAIAVFANGGTLYRPYVVDGVYLGYQSIREFNSIVSRRDFLSDETVRVVREGMREAVVSGSSIYLSQLSKPVAGKTGTAQASGGDPHAWFTGFGPYGDPSIVITVLLENGEESSKAVRVAYDIFTFYFSEARQSVSE